ncbi:uncharacterized protein PHACADRAFT_255551 [Phanerochaete carnosa HHB-10118-sp]|uniref:Uncharacterized protein n=1 Tax=Phanerochaete carnosa (strain HHB-10118-sp) TaxID=650164 RepID=K5VUD4_PHACS|nr:uncharacterized protein PHACADRAFT_255551 [Phanerochaete carnosa HHB-10118-sp]EKM55138.1 hypothetical protein PHACADRAFT_255551 [Phanerochaete carnosa HHB-10118-sp]
MLELSETCFPSPPLWMTLVQLLPVSRTIHQSYQPGLFKPHGRVSHNVALKSSLKCIKSLSLLRCDFPSLRMLFRILEILPACRSSISARLHGQVNPSRQLTLRIIFVPVPSVMSAKFHCVVAQTTRRCLLGSWPPRVHDIRSLDVELRSRQSLRKYGPLWSLSGRS